MEVEVSKERSKDLREEQGTGKGNSFGQVGWKDWRNWTPKVLSWADRWWCVESGVSETDVIQGSSYC